VWSTTEKAAVRFGLEHEELEVRLSFLIQFVCGMVLGILRKSLTDFFLLMEAPIEPVVVRMRLT